MKNYLKSVHLPTEVQERNSRLESAFESIQETIRRIQGWIDDESLRTVILTDCREDSRYITTIKLLTTRFCVISIGADDTGRYNIVMSLDSEINEKIGAQFATTLIRRMCEVTQGSMELFFIISSFSIDCDQIFSDVLTELKNGITIHQVISNEKFN